MRQHDSVLKQKSLVDRDVPPVARQLVCHLDLGNSAAHRAGNPILQCPRNARQSPPNINDSPESVQVTPASDFDVPRKMQVKRLRLSKANPNESVETFSHRMIHLSKTSVGGRIARPGKRTRDLPPLPRDSPLTTLPSSS
jgi:hypothetical protein